MAFVLKTFSTNEIVVEKSRFIALLCPLSVTKDFSYYFNEAKKTYKDARHYTYAYRYLTVEKASDDGEPQNTAGLPLLNLLKNHELEDTLLIVVRYFGGKKLGAGRLLRTYVEAGASVISQAQFYEKVPAYRYTINVPISDYDRTKFYLEKANYTVETTDFIALNVTIVVLVSKSEAETFERLYNVVSKMDDYILKEVSNE